MNDGFINSLLGVIHIAPVKWLGRPEMALTTICMLEIWQFGSSMVLFLSALKQVPQSLYEAARIDGASRVRIFFKITLPMITSIAFFNDFEGDKRSDAFRKKIEEDAGHTMIAQNLTNFMRTHGL